MDAQSQPLDPIRQRISDEIARQQKSYKSVSLAIGKSHAYIQQYIERGSPKELPERTRRAVADALGIPEIDLLPPSTEPVGASVRPAPVQIPIQGQMPADVPIWGNAAGGSKADFLSDGQPMGYAPRPPGVSRQDGIFALYVVGESMVPKFEEGNLIYASSKRVPAIGDYVIVELLPTDDDSQWAGYVKRLVKRSATKILVEQFNPPKTIEFDLKRIKHVHRVIPLEELLGV